MNEEQVKTTQECVRLSAAGEISFGEVVGRLKVAGIERYHVDYSRMAITFYEPEGGSCAVTMDHSVVPIAGEFSAAGVEAAVRRAQRGEIKYHEFTRQVCAAGCVGYFVLIAGQCVQYFGRKGEIHTEWFPGADRGR